MSSLRLGCTGCAISLVLLMALSVPAGATTRGADATRRSRPDSITATPGDGVSLVFRLTNPSRRTLRIQPRVTHPAGWHLVTPETPFDMAAGARDLRIVRVSVPADATPGRYWIVLTPIPDDARVPLRADSIAVHVRAYRRIDVALVDAPRRIAAGSTYVATFAVRNAGNVEEVVGVRIASGDDLPVSPDSVVLRLRPGASEPLRAVVRTEGARTRHLLHRLGLRVATIGRDSALAVTAASLVELVPRETAPAPRFHRLPAEVSLRRVDVRNGVSGAPDAVFYTGELRARGMLTEGGHTELDLLLRGPQPEALVAFGERDEYRLGLRSPHLDLHLGDQSVVLSPLTESGRSGFGASGRITAGRLTLGGFTTRSRWGSVLFDDSRRGGFATARLTDHSTLGVTYLSRRGTDAGSLWSIGGTLAPVAGTQVYVEYGAGAGTTGRGTANMITLAGSYSRLGFTVQHLAADAEYPGSVRGTSYDGASAWLRIWRRLAIHGQLSDRSGSLPSLTATIADRQQRMEGGIAYASAIAADYVRTEHGGGSLFLGSGGVEESLRLRTSLRFRALTFGGFAERGQFRNSGPAAMWRPFERDGVQVALAPGTRMSYGAALDRYAGSSLYAPWAQDRVSATFNATLRLSHDATRIGFLARGVRDGAMSSLQSGTLDATVEQRLPFGHEVSARVRLRTFSGVSALDQSVAEFSYRVPLGIPVSHSRASARIVGRVYDVETGRGVANVLVRAGGRAILTDGAGRLLLTGMLPGVQYVELDRGSIGLDRVTTQENPLPVKATSEGTARIELGVVRGARVSGRVEVFDAPAVGAQRAGAALERVGGLQGAIVTLTSGRETVRRLTDGEGRFGFEDLRPGRWTLRVEPAMLPPEHTLEQAVYELDVAPGGTATIAARVLPRKRAIHIIVQGELTARAGDSTAVAHLRPAGEAAPPATLADSSRRRVGAAGRAAHAPPARRRTIRHRYTVTAWDTDLSSIAGFVYGDSALWPKLWVANRHQLRSPYRLRAGQQLLVPDAAPLTAEETAARDAYVARHPARTGDTRSSAPVRHRYTVTRWDTDLSSIATFVYGDATLWPKLWVANRCRLGSPTALPEGIRLVVPDPRPLTEEEIRARDALAREGTDPARAACSAGGRRP